MIENLSILLRDSDFPTFWIVWSPLSRFLSSAAEEVFPLYETMAYDVAQTLIYKELHKRMGQPVVKPQSYIDLLKVFIENENVEVQNIAPNMFGIMSEFLKGDAVLQFLCELINLTTSSKSYIRHASVLTITSVLRRNLSMVCESEMLTPVLECLKITSGDTEYPVRVTSIMALEWLAIHQSQIGKEGIVCT
jgi:hypothetical protein